MGGGKDMLNGVRGLRVRWSPLVQPDELEERGGRQSNKKMQNGKGGRKNRKSFSFSREKKPDQQNLLLCGSITD